MKIQLNDRWGDPTAFINAFESFFEGCKAKANPEVPHNWETRVGSRYVLVVRDGSAHCFVDRTNGDVLKPATFKVPAKHAGGPRACFKHARGNIFDAHNGLGMMGPYGPAYLR